MFLDVSEDYQTVWKLAHLWADVPFENSDPTNLPLAVRTYIHRMLSAIANKHIAARNRNRLIFADEGAFDFLFFELFNYMKLLKVQRREIFDKPFLDSIYVKRPEVLRWCQTDFLEPPSIWKLPEPLDTAADSKNAQEDEDETGWYDSLTDPRKKRVACLEMAKLLWKANPKLSYAEVYNHPAMAQYGNRSIFTTLNSFKRWAGKFAPEEIRQGGRHEKSSNYDDLIASKSK